jgi:hypothetical protein
MTLSGRQKYSVGKDWFCDIIHFMLVQRRVKYPDE